MKKLPLPAQHPSQRAGYAHQREAIYDRIWQELPEIIDGVIDLAKGVKVSEDQGTTVYQQPPSLEAAKFLIERVDGRAKGSVDVSGTMEHSWDGLLDRMVAERGQINVTPIRPKPAAGEFAQPAEESAEDGEVRRKVVSIDRDQVLASLLEPVQESVPDLFDMVDGHEATEPAS